MSKIGIGTTAVGTGADPGDTIVTEMAFGQPATPGILTTFSREDHTHGTPAAPPAPPVAGDTVVTEIAFGQAATAGALATFSREDHTHGTPPAPAGGGGGHLGIGGGTLIAGVPLYNYEDHDMFTTSWMWELHPCFAGTSGELQDSNNMLWYHKWEPNPMSTTQFDSQTGECHIDNLPCWKDASQAIRYGAEFWLNGLTYLPFQVTYHMMVKSWKLRKRPASVDYCMCIGFWLGNLGMDWGVGNSNKGIGFGYSTKVPAIFPNPNWYAVSSTDATYTAIKAKDTGIPIVGNKHKFNVVVGPHVATFYIDNVLVQTITKAECVAGEWPDFVRTWPTVAIRNRASEDQRDIGMDWEFPFIAGADHVGIGP